MGRLEYNHHNDMNIETLVIILAVAFVAAIFARFVSGWTFGGLLTSYLLACFGGIGGWYAQQQLGLPPLYSVAFPGDNVPVAIVWPAVAALVLALIGAAFTRRTQPQIRRRKR